MQTTQELSPRSAEPAVVGDLVVGDPDPLLGHDGGDPLPPGEKGEHCDRGSPAGDEDDAKEAVKDAVLSTLRGLTAMTVKQEGDDEAQQAAAATPPPQSQLAERLAESPGRPSSRPPSSRSR